jgi:hypothetical protein
MVDAFAVEINCFRTALSPPLKEQVALQLLRQWTQFARATKMNKK